MTAKCHSLEYNYNLKKKSALAIFSKCIFDGCFSVFVIDFFSPSPSLELNSMKSYIVAIINGDIKSIRNLFGITNVRF